MLRSPRGSVPHACTTRAHVRSAQELSKLDDAALLDAMSEGSEPAFGELFIRYADTVRRFARRTYGATSDADDLVAEAFFRVLQSARRGGGRIEYPQAYLLTVARRIAMEWSARRRDVPVDDDELAGKLEATADRTAGSVERHLIERAFGNLPERWRSVLWRVEVEGERPSVVGGYLGLSANATAALARRARDGLRAAYLQAHLADRPGPVSCRSVVTKLGAFTYGSVRGAERRRIRRHLAGCESCAALHAELADVCSGLRAHASAIGPLIGAGTAVHHLATGSTWPLTAGSASAAKTALGAGGKLAALAGRTKVAIAATATAGVGVLGLVSSGVLHGEADSHALSGYDGGRGNQVMPVCTSCATGTSGAAVSRPTTHHSPSVPGHVPIAGTTRVSATDTGGAVDAGDRARGRERADRAGAAAFHPASASQQQRAATVGGRSGGRKAEEQPMTVSRSSEAPGGARVRSSDLPGWVRPATAGEASTETGTVSGPATTAAPGSTGAPGSTAAPGHDPSGASDEHSTDRSDASSAGGPEQARAGSTMPTSTARDPRTPGASNAGSGPHPYRLRSGDQPRHRTVLINVVLLPNHP